MITLRPWQVKIAEKIYANKRCLIYALPGFGKTIGLLAGNERVKPTFPTLIIAPLVVCLSVWPKEIANYCGEDTKVLQLAGITKAKFNKVATIENILNSDYVLINLESFKKLALICQDLSQLFEVIGLDESSKIRKFKKLTKKVLEAGFLSDEAKATRAQILFYATQGVERFVQLTGTPATRDLEGVWGQCYFADEGERLGSSLTAFRDVYFDSKPIRGASSPFARNYTPKPNAIDEIAKQIRDIAMYVNPADYKDYFKLKPTLHNVIKIKLDDKTDKLYKQYKRELGFVFEGDMFLSPNAAVAYFKLSEIGSGFIKNPEDGNIARLHEHKLDALEVLLDELEGEPLILVSYFVETFKMIKERFPDAVVIKSNSTKEINEFNEGKIRLALVQPSSLAYGVNLAEKCNNTLFYELGPDLEKHQQVRERAGAMRQFQAGKTVNVVEHYFLATDHEIKMYEKLKEKEVLQTSFMEAIDS